MSVKTQEQEQAELLQTVEMFEAVARTNPDDYQSLEILKEAYSKLGREQDTLRVSKQIARAHEHIGQVSQALLLYEGILQKYPEDAEARAALDQLQKQAHLSPVPAERSVGREAAAGGGNGAATAPTESAAEEPSGKKTHRLRPSVPDKDGDESLCDLIIKQGLLKEKDVLSVLHVVQAANAHLAEDSIRMTLVQAFSDRGLMAPEQLLAFLTEKTNLPYVPLGLYEVIPDIVRLQPRDVSFKHCIMPFDRISRTLLMATANPLDERAKKAAQKVLDYNLQWYVCSPMEITQILKDVFLVGKPSKKDD